MTGLLLGVLMAVAGAWLGWLLFQAILSVAALPNSQPTSAPVAATPLAPPPPTEKSHVIPAAFVKPAPPPRGGHPERIEQPEGEYRVEPLGGAVITLSGHVGRLHVDLVENSKLDASGLEAKEIVLVGRIDSRSILLLNAPAGKVEFRNSIAGDSAVIVTAREVDLQGLITGGKTSVKAKLTSGGTLRFKEISGAAQLKYRKQTDGDAAPTIVGGTIREEARLIRED
jgi:hypothetical protein